MVVFFCFCFSSIPSLRNVGKLLKVHHGLLHSLPQSASSELLLDRTSGGEVNPVGNKLVTLSADEACLVLHRLGSDAQLMPLVSAVEAELTRYNVQLNFCKGVRTNEKAERDSKKEVQEAENADDEDGVSKEKPELQADQEKDVGKVLPSPQWFEEIEECESDDKVLARNLLVELMEIFALTQRVEFT